MTPHAEDILVLDQRTALYVAPASDPAAHAAAFGVLLRLTPEASKKS